MPARQFNAGSYKYGFNGKENDNEVKGNGNSVDFGSREYDSRLAKWFSIDPGKKSFPDQSPYNYAINNPIYWIDPSGGTVTPVGFKATFGTDVFKYENKKNTLGEAFSRADNSVINYIVVFQAGQAQANADIRWNGIDFDESQNQTVVITITVDQTKSFADQIDAAQQELGKAFALVGRVEDSRLGFVKTENNQYTEAGLDYQDIAASQEGGAIAAKSHAVPTTGSVKKYQELNVAKGGDKAKKAFVNNYKENKQKVFKEKIKQTGSDGLKNVLNADMTGVGTETEVHNQRTEQSINGFMYKRGNVKVENRINTKSK